MPANNLDPIISTDTITREIFDTVGLNDKSLDNQINSLNTENEFQGVGDKYREIQKLGEKKNTYMRLYQNVLDGDYYFKNIIKF